jgi:hypothetical protein
MSMSDCFRLQKLQLFNYALKDKIKYSGGYFVAFGYFYSAVPYTSVFQINSILSMNVFYIVKSINLVEYIAQMLSK